MDSYKVEFTKRAENELRRIDSRFIPRVLSAAEALAADPRPVGSKKLIGSEHTHRIRVGNYRIIYDIEASKLVILIVKVRHRQSASE